MNECPTSETIQEISRFSLEPSEYEAIATHIEVYPSSQKTIQVLQVLHLVRTGDYSISI